MNEDIPASLSEAITHQSILAALAGTSSGRSQRAVSYYARAIPRYFVAVTASLGMRWAREAALDAAQDFLTKDDGIFRAAAGYLETLNVRRTVRLRWRTWLKRCAWNYLVSALRREARRSRFEVALGEESEDGGLQAKLAIAASEPPAQPELGLEQSPSLNGWLARMRGPTFRREGPLHKARRNGVMLRLYLERIRANLRPDLPSAQKTARKAKYGKGHRYLAERFFLTSRAIQDALRSAGRQLIHDLREELGDEQILQFVKQVLESADADTPLLSESGRATLVANPFENLILRTTPVKAAILCGLATMAWA